MRIAIVGSCVTRDVLEVGSHDFDAVQYHARTSWVSQASEPWPGDVEVGPELAGRFGERMVREDLAKDVVDQVVAGQPDLVVLDLIDERFPVLRFDRSWVTWSNYLEQVPALTELEEHADERLPFGDERRHDLFRAAAGSRLVALAEALPKVPLVLHQAWFTAASSDPEVRMYEGAAAHSERMNSALERSYDAMSDALGDRLVRVEAPRTTLFADAGHRWGLAHFHYVPEYYTPMLATLTALARGEHAAAPVSTHRPDPLDPAAAPLPPVEVPSGARRLSQWAKRTAKRSPATVRAVQRARGLARRSGS